MGDSSDSLEIVERRVLEFGSSVQDVESSCSRMSFRWWIYISYIGVANLTIVHPLDILEMIRAV